MIAQLDDAVVSWLADLPRDVDIVAGIPRSGLLVANLLALHLNVPMTDIAGLGWPISWSRFTARAWNCQSSGLPLVTGTVAFPGVALKRPRFTHSVMPLLRP